MPAQARSGSTLRREAEIARRHTPDFAWPTLVLEAGLFLVFAAATALAVAGAIPLWLAAAINTVFIYAIYTVVHEAVHSSISARRKDLRWIDAPAGMLACMPLWLFFHHHRKSHRVHHARTNEEDDPDIYARGSFLGWCLWRLPRTLLAYFNPLQLRRECRRFGLTARERRITMAGFAAQAAVIFALIATGHGYRLLVLWFIPWWIGQSVMLTLFTWTPHHDHSETGRYRSTRVSLWPGGNALLLGQGYHLIHHMIPSVPWYRYERTFREMRPLLERQGVRIEGFWPAAQSAPAQR
jgi:beta-carotene hydroxylase